MKPSQGVRNFQLPEEGRELHQSHASSGVVTHYPPREIRSEWYAGAMEEIVALECHQGHLTSRESFRIAESWGDKRRKLKLFYKLLISFGVGVLVISVVGLLVFLAW